MKAQLTREWLTKHIEGLKREQERAQCPKNRYDIGLTVEINERFLKMIEKRGEK